MTKDKKEKALVLVEGELATLKKTRSKLLKKIREQKALTTYIEEQLIELKTKQLNCLMVNANILARIKKLNILLKDLGE